MKIKYTLEEFKNLNRICLKASNSEDKTERKSKKEFTIYIHALDEELCHSQYEEEKELEKLSTEELIDIINIHNKNVDKYWSKHIDRHRAFQPSKLTFSNTSINYLWRARKRFEIYSGLSNNDYKYVTAYNTLMVSLMMRFCGHLRNLKSNFLLYQSHKDYYIKFLEASANYTELPDVELLNILQ